MNDLRKVPIPPVTTQMAAAHVYWQLKGKRLCGERPTHCLAHCGKPRSCCVDSELSTNTPPPPPPPTHTHTHNATQHHTTTHRTHSLPHPPPPHTPPHPHTPTHTTTTTHPFGHHLTKLQ